MRITTLIGGFCIHSYPLLSTCALTSIVLVYRSYKIYISNMIYPPDDLATQLATGEHEQETEEEMLERVQREEEKADWAYDEMRDNNLE